MQIKKSKACSRRRILVLCGVENRATRRKPQTSDGRPLPFHMPKPEIEPVRNPLLSTFKENLFHINLFLSHKCYK